MKNYFFDIKEKLDNLNISIDKLYGNQLICVENKNGKILLETFEKKYGIWVKNNIRTQNVWIGHKGLIDEKYKFECDGKTPIGLYGIGFSFGIKNKPKNLKISYQVLNNNHVWIDDSSSIYYNKFIDTSKVKKDWKTCEHLIKYPHVYDYALVVKYNMSQDRYNNIPTLNDFNLKDNNIKKDKGSAIFMHVSNKNGTAGCISVTKYTMIKILKWLNAMENPQILIYNNNLQKL